MNCVEDLSVKNFYSSRDGRSPKNNIAYTVSDMLRLSNNFQSKVIGISVKDRGAILPAGKFGNNAYWMDDSLMTSSTYYGDSLPEWVKNFNAQKNIDAYFGREWKKILPEKAYTLCDDDSANYESDEDGLGRTFPHLIQGKENIKKSKSFYNAFLISPFASEILLAFAQEAIQKEELGKRGVTDMLCISFSANDYIGHTYGMHSQEVMDVTIRTDKMLEELLLFLEKEIGLNNCILTLTADHGATPVPEYIKNKYPNADAGKSGVKELQTKAEQVLSGKFGALSGATKWIDNIVDYNIYISENVSAAKNISVNEAAIVLRDSLRNEKGIAEIITTQEIRNGTVYSSFSGNIEKSYFPQRSGDVIYILKPFFIRYAGDPGTHGNPYSYDAHVPLIFFGKGIASKTSEEKCEPIDLAATLASLLGIELPPMSVGRVLEVRSKK